MFDIDPGNVALLIPIIAIFGGLTIAVIGIIMNNKQEELRHKERILAMEKGVALPEMPKEEKRPAYLKLRAWGIIVTFVGLAITIAYTVSRGFMDGAKGLIVTAVGLGLLVAGILEERNVTKK